MPSGLNKFVQWFERCDYASVAVSPSQLCVSQTQLARWPAVCQPSRTSPELENQTPEQTASSKGMLARIGGGRRARDRCECRTGSIGNLGNLATPPVAAVRRDYVTFYPEYVYDTIDSACERKNRDDSRCERFGTKVALSSVRLSGAQSFIESCLELGANLPPDNWVCLSARKSLTTGEIRSFSGHCPNCSHRTRDNVECCDKCGARWPIPRGRCFDIICRSTATIDHNSAVRCLQTLRASMPDWAVCQSFESVWLETF